MVELRLNQRLGNTMFQYAVARILADRIDCSLATISQTHPDVRLSTHFPNAPLSIDRPGYQGGSPPVALRQHWTQTIQHLDLNRVIALRPQRILVDGYFELFDHLVPFQNCLHEIFFRPLKPPIGHLAVHLRLGDVARRTAQVPAFIDYAILVARQNPDLPIDLVVETPTDPFAQESLKRLERETKRPVEMLWHADVVDSFDHLRQCPVMVVTNSTWTWWCGFLTPQARVHVGISNRQPCAFRNRSLFCSIIPANFSVFDLDRGQSIDIERAAP